MSSSIAPLWSAVRQWIGRPFLDLALSLGGEILKLAAGGVEGVANSHINIVVGTVTSGSRLTTISAAPATVRWIRTSGEASLSFRSGCHSRST